jgi:hypothetical protein
MEHGGSAARSRPRIARAAHSLFEAALLCSIDGVRERV